MVDAINPSTSTYDPPIDDPDDDDRRRAAATTQPATRFDPAQLPDVNGALIARAAQAAVTGASPRPILGFGLTEVFATDARAHDVAVQGRLRAFVESTAPGYRMPDGPVVHVATPFRMVASTEVHPGDSDFTRSYAHREKLVQANTPELAEIARQHGITNIGAILVGRGTPQQIQVLTQALIDKGRLPSTKGLSPEDRVRTMMCNYGLGFDCAGFTQQAVLAANGITPVQAGFTNILNEDLSHLSPAKFSRVSPDQASPGDIIALAPPPGDATGHRLVVYDRHAASPEELRLYGAKGLPPQFASGRVSILTVQSSFGSSGDPTKGGVQQQTWLYDATSNQWARLRPDDTVSTPGLPYDGLHPLLGVYHYKDGH